MKIMKIRHQDYNFQKNRGENEIIKRKEHIIQKNEKRQEMGEIQLSMILEFVLIVTSFEDAQNPGI